MKKNLLNYLHDFGFCTEAEKSLTNDFDKLSSHAEALALLEKRVDEYKNGILDWTAIGEDAKRAAALTDIHEFTASLLFYIALVPYSYHFFEEKGLGHKEWYGSMIDLRWKSENCFKIHGIWGVSTSWFKSFFTADRIAFGRLQFNLIEATRDFIGGGFSVKQGETLVTVHIPEDTRTPFPKENREEAYRLATKYYSKLLGKEEIIFYCGTWLLHPVHRVILPEGSNIRSFLDDFYLFEDSFKETDGNISRLFYVKEYNGDPTTLPEDTSMMRAYKKYMLEGGKIGTIVGLRKQK